MFIEIDVESGNNCEFSLTRLFSSTGNAVQIFRLETFGIDGQLSLHDVTGWSTEGPCPAFSVMVEDSGEGVALLVYGGNDGIRLRSSESTESWKLDSQTQWGEPCLLLDQSVYVETR